VPQAVVNKLWEEQSVLAALEMVWPYQSRPGERVRSSTLPLLPLTYLVPALVATTRHAINVIIRGLLTTGGGEESSIPYDVITTLA
jgi:hypothetical protein